MPIPRLRRHTCEHFAMEREGAVRESGQRLKRVGNRRI